MHAYTIAGGKIDDVLWCLNISRFLFFQPLCRSQVKKQVHITTLCAKPIVRRAKNV